MINNIIIFSILQLINVFFSTIKTLTQIKGTKLQATLMNSFYYAFYTIVVIFMNAEFALWVKVLITFITNLIGVYASMTLLERMKKDKLWKIEFTVNADFKSNIKNELEKVEVPNSYQDLGKHCMFTCFCAKQEDSKNVKNIIYKYNGKYFVSENKTIL